MSLEERLMSKCMPEPNSGCWLWIGAINSGGYGHIGVAGKTESAHRVSYETFKCEEIPAGMDLDHLCRMRCCINPEHLQPVTRSVNCGRGFTGHASGLRQRSKMICPEGHPYIEENTYRDKGGNRHCIICRYAATKRWYAKNRDQQILYYKQWRKRQEVS